MAPSSTGFRTLQRHLWREKSRRRPDDPWAWAMAHRRLGDGALLTPIPALIDIARDPHDFIVIQKSA